MLKRDLIKKLKEQGLPTTGVKAELELRYLQHQKLINNQKAQISTEASADQDNEPLLTFDEPSTSRSSEESNLRESSFREIAEENFGETSSEDDDEGYDLIAEKILFNPTVLALPVFCNIKVNNGPMTIFKKRVGSGRTKGYKLGVCMDNKERPQISGIANIRDSNIKSSRKKHFHEIDTPEKYEPWKRYLIQPTSL